jgi:hypothetical protein
MHQLPATAEEEVALLLPVLMKEERIEEVYGGGALMHQPEAFRSRIYRTTTRMILSFAKFSMENSYALLDQPFNELSMSSMMIFFSFQPSTKLMRLLPLELSSCISSGISVSILLLFGRYARSTTACSQIGC